MRCLVCRSTFVYHVLGVYGTVLQLQDFVRHLYLPIKRWVAIHNITFQTTDLRDHHLDCVNEVFYFNVPGTLPSQLKMFSWGKFKYQNTCQISWLLLGGHASTMWTLSVQLCFGRTGYK